MDSLVSRRWRCTCDAQRPATRLNESAGGALRTGTTGWLIAYIDHWLAVARRSVATGRTMVLEDEDR